MESKLINCPKCGKQYNVFLEAHNYFQCYDCDGIIEYNSTPLQRADFVKPTRQPVANPNYRITQHQTQSTSFDIGKFATYCFLGTFGVICVVALFDAMGSLGSMVNHSTATATQQTYNQPITTKLTPPSSTNNGSNTSPVSQQNVSPCIIKESTITFDANFEPSAHLVLKNQSTKVITQVILMFDFSDMSGWANTSVSRSLAEPFKTYINLTVKIQPGQTAEGNLKIPLPQSKGKDKPSISIVKIRFEDGSISN
jgi:hypothetical protein